MKFFWRCRGDHILFWMIMLLFYAYVRYDLVKNVGFTYYLLDIAIRNGIIVLACYVNMYALVPRYLRKGAYAAYFVSVFASLLVFTGTKLFLDSLVEDLAGYDQIKQGLFYNTYYNFSILLFYVVFTMALETSKQWFQQQVTLKRIQMENLQTELRFLKAQMNPHFLFNSINTIYFQIDKKNTEARASLEKFAELLRYQLYECNEDTICIEKEIEYLQSYVDLQRLRKNDSGHIQFTAGDEVKGFVLAPLLLLPFVENAFKHAGGCDDQPLYVDVKLNKVNGNFLFAVSNSKSNTEAAKEHQGIGLKNVQRRLDLLYFEKYDLSIHNSERSYEVKLQIPIL